MTARELVGNSGVVEETEDVLTLDDVVEVDEEAVEMDDEVEVDDVVT